MKRQGGFTLIEMVVVIVILGILAVTAAPRFLNLQDDARRSALQGLKGAIDGAAGIVYGKAAIKGLEADDNSNNKVDKIKVKFGYPIADHNDGIGQAFVSDDWVAITNSGTSINDGTDYSKVAKNLIDGEIVYTFKDRTTAGCYVLYTQSDKDGDEIIPASTKVVGGEGCIADPTTPNSGQK